MIPDKIIPGDGLLVDAIPPGRSHVILYTLLAALFLHLFIILSDRSGVLLV